MTALSRVDASPQDARPLRDRGWLRTALVANLLCQGGIIITGGLVRLTGSGLGCPTWPQCVEGSFTPVRTQEQGIHSLIEFGNRLLTFVLAAAAVAVIIGAYKFAKDRPALLRWSWVPLLGIVAQAVLGGIIVWTKLDPRTVSPHFLLSIALVAFSVWLLYRYDEGDGPRQRTVHPVVARLAHVTAAVAGVVIILGTAVTGSGPHSGDAEQPVRFGFDPQATSWLHADSVMLFTGLVIALVVASRISAVPERFVQAWRWVLVVCVIQGAIGYTQYFAGLPIVLVTLHLIGSAVLTALISYGVMTTRRR